MKISILSTLFLAALAEAAIDDDKLEECTDCLEDIDDARDCLRECNAIAYTNFAGEDVSRLAECLTVDGDFGNINTLGDLTDCCEFDRNCENDLFDVQECLVDCIDICIKDDALAWFECIADETGTRGCELTACLDGFLSDDIEDSISLAGSQDIFDLRTIADTVESIDEDDVNDCELLRDFVETACDLGRSCCDRCEPQLGAVVGCLVNDVVIPFVAIETNTTIDTCPIDEPNCQLLQGAVRKTKELSQEEADLFNKALNLPKAPATSPQAQTKRGGKKAALIEAFKNRRLEGLTAEELVTQCEDQLKLDMVAHNTTYASNKYMECVSFGGISLMSDVDETPESETSEDGSAAPIAAKFVALAFTFATALFV